MSNAKPILLSFNPIDAAAIATVLGRYDRRSSGEIIIDFERGLAEQTGSQHVVGLNTGTAAIHLALKALDVGIGDHVIVSTFTYVASLTPILYLQAEPVLVDVDPQTWNINTELLVTAIEAGIRKGKKPKAIMAVHTYGMPADMKAILAIGNLYSIPILEDAAEAIGSSYHGKALGTLGEIGVLSFNNNKLLTTYGGGAVLTPDESVAARILFMATHARLPLPYYQHEEEGYNYRMSGISAAVGLAGLGEVEKNVAARRLSFERYRKLFADEANILWQEELNNCRSNRWFSCILVGAGADEVRRYLGERNIETRPLWKPMHRQPLFRSCEAFIDGTADDLFASGICLPSGNSLSDTEAEVVSGHVRTALYRL